MSYIINNKTIKSGVIFNMLAAVQGSKYTPDFHWQEVFDCSEFMDDFYKTKYTVNSIARYLDHAKLWFICDGAEVHPNDVFEDLEIPNFTLKNAVVKTKSSTSVSKGSPDQEKRIKELEKQVRDLIKAVKELQCADLTE